MVEVTSFDVFDTVLTRRIGSPESSFLLLGKKLVKLGLVDCTAESFARIRQEAEGRAFDNAGGLDSKVTLDHIYREVGFVLRLEQQQCSPLIAMELEMEADLLQPVPEGQSKLQAARDRGDRILFLSDMYLGDGFIHRQLTRHGLFLPGDRLYVSCDHGKAKGSGKLYAEMLRQEGVEAEAVSHCGNHRWSDIGAAKRAGLQVDPFPQGNLNRYERILDAYAWQTEGLASALAGASRLARLTLPAPCEKTRMLRDVTTGVAAPLLIGFTLWTLKRAKQLGLKRLYFLSRDGQILLAIARRLLPKLNFDCELRYLYGSRQAWLLPSMTAVDEAHLDLIFPPNKDVDLLSIRIVLARFSIEPEAIAAILQGLGWPASDWERNLSATERQELRQALLTDPSLQQLILHQAQQQRQIMLDYLHQEGLLKTEGAGLVDLGTGATLHKALASVLATAKVEPPVSFYLGLRPEVQQSRFKLPEPYIYDGRIDLGFLNAAGLTGLLESVCSADHGSVMGYRHSGDQIEPVLTTLTNDRVMDWGFPLIQASICTTAELLLLDEALLNPWANVCQAVLETFSAFWLDPTPAEATAWGSFPLEDGWGKAACYLPLAEGYGWSDLFVLNKHRHWWYEGALAQTAPPLRQAFKLRAWVGGLLRQPQPSGTIKQKTIKQKVKETVQTWVQPSAS